MHAKSHMCSNPLHCQEGLSKLGQQADRSTHAQALFSAEEKAKALKKNIWKDYIEPVAQEESDDVDTHAKDEASSEDSSQPKSDKKPDFQKVCFCV